ncbi:hypothetical protein [Stenotrophomonas sp. Iso1]|uniref:hypothetical protein n=1 Tax=Stenotrophomonas sp. Iso1 TaxID=2977283 RepID=UPI0022B7A9D9|nr:hypothetical protein [Stenotrophomonas sp. Iso1]
MPVTSVTDFIDLLAARRQASILHDRRTGMPYSWSHWVRTRVSKAMSAFAEADVAGVIAAKPGRSRERVSTPRPFLLTMLLLLWQGGDPPPRDQRVMRWFAAFFSAALHLLFALLLVWVALIRSPAPEQSAEEGERVQIEYIGRGTPDEEGGGAPQAQGEPQADASASASASSAAAGANAGASSSAAVATPVEPTATAAVTPADVSNDEQPLVPIDASKPSPEMPAAQPLQVTQTQQPTTDFVLPAPTLRPPTMTAPSVSVPEVRVRERVVETAADRPQITQSARVLPNAQPQLRTPEVQVRERQIETMPQQQVEMAQLRQRVTDVQMAGPEMAVRERQVDAAPTQPVTMAQVRSSQTNDVQLKTPMVDVRERHLPGAPDVSASSAAPAGAAAKPASASGSGSATSAQSSNVAQGSTAQGSSAAANPSPRPGTSAGAGPKPQDRSGGWDSPMRSDDWGASQRQVAGSAGGQSDKGRGLFDADGGVRLADDGAGKDSKRGAPGGDADSWTRDRIADSGTWLKRPPYDYTPTSFDKYWVPNESLLAEWVRKGIKSVEIPIPGTSSKISCVVSMLQFGGGCGLTNPNMQEQPAVARPPPDIPFKKELQEDNGSR